MHPHKIPDPDGVERKRLNKPYSLNTAHKGANLVRPCPYQINDWGSFGTTKKLIDGLFNAKPPKLSWILSNPFIKGVVP